VQSLLPQRIVCLVVETTKWLYPLGKEARIVGISINTVRPHRAREEKPKVCAFLSAKIVKILALQPNSVFGLFDRPADSAAIPKGLGRTITDAYSMSERYVDIPWVGLQVFSYGEAQHA
jgi:iron complex transport system substrate-binding protein